MKYGKEKMEEICGYIGDLYGRLAACKKAGIHFDTFNTWMKTRPEFNAAIKKAEAVRTANGEEVAVLTIFKAMQKGTWQAAAWWLERTFKSKYGKTDEVDVNVKGKKFKVDIVE